MSDRIELIGLEAFGYHGVFDHERQDGQRFLVDVVLEVDSRPAAASDDLADTVDYGAIAELAVAVVTGPPCNLIETVAARIANEVIADEKVRRVEVTVHKPSAPIPRLFTDVRVVAVRERR